MAILFLTLFEQVVVIIRYTAIVILVTPTAEPCVLTVCGVQLTTTEQTDDMVAVRTKVCVITYRTTEVCRKQRVLCQVINTTFR